MRSLSLLLAGTVLGAAPVGWTDLPVALRTILARGGLDQGRYATWQAKRTQELRVRLDNGSAEHVAYFLLQSRAFTDAPALDPMREARIYLRSLKPDRWDAFLAGEPGGAPLNEPIRRRAEAFWQAEARNERHRLLRAMAATLGWRSEQILETAFRFLLQRSEEDDADALYQRRGLSADPFPATMRAVERGLMKTGGGRDAVLLAGPGAELGSRFGVDDARPVQSTQPGALLALNGRKPARFDCVDIRQEVVDSLAGGPCKAARLDIAGEALPVESYDLAVATNLLVYLNEEELGVAMGNLGRALRPGGCLVHNDSRFAARLFGEAAGMPVIYFESVTLGRRGGREQMDRVVVHCRPVAGPF